MFNPTLLPFGFGFFGFIALVSLACFIFWVWALVDVLKSDFKDGVTKVVWLIVCLLVPVPGFILYFFIGRKQKLAVVVG